MDDNSCNFTMPAFQMSKKSWSCNNTSSHVGLHSDWEDWTRTKPFWSADMPLQARRKTVSCFRRTFRRESSWDSSVLVQDTYHSLWIFASFAKMMCSSKMWITTFYKEVSLDINNFHERLDENV